MKKVVAIIQARMGSTRLPGKVLIKIKRKTILEHVITRVRTASDIDEIVIATTTNQQDDLIVDECKKLGINYFRGNENDVLSRYYNTSKKYQADIIIRITSDCPVIDPIIINKMLLKFIRLNKTINIDYMNNTLEPTYPRGLDTEIFTFNCLERAYIESKKDYEREHVTPYIYENPNKFKLYIYKNRSNLSNYRLTLDTREDLELIKRIYDELYTENKLFYLEDILKLLEKYPEILQFNKNISQKKLGE